MFWVGVMFYGAVVWDPWLIVAQIVCLQCMYYITLGLLLAVLVGTRVSRLSLVYFFDYVMLLPLPLLVGAFVLHFCSAQLQGNCSLPPFSPISSFVNVFLLLEFVIGNYYLSNHGSRVVTFCVFGRVYLFTVRSSLSCDIKYLSV